MMFYANAVMCLGSALCLIENISVILVGRLIWGLGSGAFVVFVPKFINETAPNEYKGSFGVMTQFMCCLGIFIPSLMGLPLPTPEKLAENPLRTDFLIGQYWRIFFGLPIVFAIVQMVLLLFVFPYDTPVALKTNKNFDLLTQVMSKIYKKNQVAARIEEIAEEQKETKENQGPSYSETFCNPKIRRAAWIGCSVSVFQQLTGINAIIFYSSSIFSDVGLNPNVVNALLGGVNLVAATSSSGILAYAGRKTMLVATTFGCAVFLFLMGLASFEATNNSAWNIVVIVGCCFFLVMFQWGPGPITWIYMSEVMNNKGVAVGTSINLTLTLCFALFTKPLFNSLNAWTFIMFGAIQAVAGIFLIFFMKETKGLTEY